MIILKRPFGALTGQLQIYGFLGFQHSGRMDQAHVNVDFNFGHAALINGKHRVDNKNSNASMGAIHMLPFELHQYLLTVSKNMHQKRKRLRRNIFSRNRKQSGVRRIFQGKIKSLLLSNSTFLHFITMKNSLLLHVGKQRTKLIGNLKGFILY